LKCSDEDEAFRLEIERREFDSYPFCIVMPAADKDLQLIILTEYIAGNDWPVIKHIAFQIGS
jgi:hypothetical protein